MTKMCAAVSAVVLLQMTFLVMMTKTNASNTKLDIRMPGVSPKHPDTYLCVGTKVPSGNQFIVKYEPEADMSVVHHMLLYGCRTPARKNGAWNCRLGKGNWESLRCAGGKSTILYAWARNAGPLEMPKDTGMHVGGSSGFNYFVLEVHYLHVKQFRNGHTDHSGMKITLDDGWKKHLAGVYLVANALTWSRSIPPHVEKYHMDTGCIYKPTAKPSPILHAFRFRVHTHSLGTVVTGYRVRNGHWTLIGRGDPQEPQAFNPTDNLVDIRPGDILMMRCTFNSQSRKEVTHYGPTHQEEMCRFYLMYYYEANENREFRSVICEGSGSTKRLLMNTMIYPDDSDVPKKIRDLIEDEQWI